MEQGADDARHAGRMAEISADNATAAANNAARLAHQSAVNGKMAVEEGREQAEQIESLIIKSMRFTVNAIEESLSEYVHPRIDELNLQNMKAADQLDKLLAVMNKMLIQNKLLNERLGRVEQRLSKQINQVE
ncbi:MAG: hypothetical protein B7Z79_13105 [Thiomonas sp. 20-64-9]|nr:MAG: hypothetical protein B7Z79_13105 [Thiomonas sp. 20-64-9]